MTFPESLSIVDSVIPVVIGGSIGLLALLGIRELFKETSEAFKKGAKA